MIVGINTFRNESFSFVISGLIKLNDPVGFSFKLKDYFAPDVLNIEFFSPFALMIALFVVIFEVLIGVMLLIGYAKKFTIWSSLLMIVFFTFLTFYSAYFNKVTDCGCFGDAVLAVVLPLHRFRPFFLRAIGLAGHRFSNAGTVHP